MTINRKRRPDRRRAGLIPRGLALALFFLSLSAVGCTGRGDVVELDLAAQPIPVQAVTEDPAPLRVAVWPPETTTRSELWSREHLWSGKTYFTVPGGNVPAAVALTTVEHFRRHGWQAWLEAPHPGDAGSPADIVLSGRLDDLSASATSYLFRTHLQVSFSMTVKAMNANDDSTMHMRLRGTGTDRVSWFEPSDLQQLVRAVVQESLDKFLAQTTVENRALRARAGIPSP